LIGQKQKKTLGYILKQKMSHDHDDSNYEDEINENQHLLSSNRVNNNDKNRNIGISWYFAVFLIVNAALGAGLLNFAKAFDNAGGILYSSLIQIVNIRFSIRICEIY